MTLNDVTEPLTLFQDKREGEWGRWDGWDVWFGPPTQHVNSQIWHQLKDFCIFFRSFSLLIEKSTKVIFFLLHKCFDAARHFNKRRELEEKTKWKFNFQGFPLLRAKITGSTLHHEPQKSRFSHFFFRFSSSSSSRFAPNSTTRARRVN